ncbi:MAG: AAA family ATPase, partial [Clostridia bacterium]|nr:AAA family ATPase [Clostridia bacterium]
MGKDTEKEIRETETEIASLPRWNIVRKCVNGNEYYYRRLKVDGKNRDVYIEKDAVEEEKAKVERRKELEKRLKALKLEAMEDGAKTRKVPEKFVTAVDTGRDLLDRVGGVRAFKKRECYAELLEYLRGDVRGKVFVLYGLRRTGKTTLMWQAIADMDEEPFKKAAYIDVKPGDDLVMLSSDLRKLRNRGFEYIFIDEMTAIEGFIRGSAMLSDVFAGYGMKIVLSGTDSLGFRIAAEDELYDRYVMVHTTFIPYREFENVLGVKGLDEYIRYGGTMSKSGKIYNRSPAVAQVNVYVNTAIAANIQNSLKNYREGGRFRNLADLYERGELTSAINRVIEDMNHAFTVKVLTREFRPNDFASSVSNLKNDRKSPVDVTGMVDTASFTERLKKLLDILNLPEQTVSVSDVHAREIKEYLKLLDLVCEVDCIDVSRGGYVHRPITVISQPGLRYAQAEALVESLLDNAEFAKVDAGEKKRILDRIHSEILGRMTEEIVLLETQVAYPERHVFKLEFDVGEFDMVVADRENVT